MSVGMNANLIYASIRDRNQNQADKWADSARNDLSGTTGSSMRAFEHQQRVQDKKEDSVVNQSISYADSLRVSRSKAKEASLQKKKLQYNFKKISSQIITSKNSNSARMAVTAARREVLRLKKLQASGEYDDEEIQISIDHAKSMERIAKKKLAHLEQEEMIERGHKSAMGGLEEKEKTEDEQNQDEELEKSEDELSEEEMNGDEGLDPDVYYPEEFELSLHELVQDAQDAIAFRMEELAVQMQDQMDEIQESSMTSMDQLMNELSEGMKEMLEDLNLDDLANTIAAPDPNMSESDLKMLKLKHRTKEMKEIAKADGEYLKSIMDKYEKKGIAGINITSGSGAFLPGNALSGGISPVTVTIPSAYGSGAPSMGIDIFA
ncbi:hypothetical protein [Butyrivibrio sp. AE2032]|uniref:hypothetical protein n=1 Tax=Butyrivibrio sp. AE2032 TaxID=1458463 RepID=UPI000550BF29|nr:hypothetical protein [Butyrivibrio sp. AE2032]